MSKPHIEELFTIVQEHGTALLRANRERRFEAHAAIQQDTRKKLEAIGLGDHFDWSER